ncbi:MAG TPA: flagellar hook capping FlgD N-terminal domain-containing protein [Phycisphaerales bacterium]|nr:flagellar hook capping FlgD N-terminal domain-containing protein [Phycisphaerales bacterium]
MSTIDGIGGSAPAGASAGGVSGLSSDEFLKLLFTELNNQDPLEPNDTGALLEQIANIRSIQSDLDLGERLTDLVGQNQLAAGSGLIGRLVSGLSETSQRVTGVVHSVSKTEDGVVLNIQGGSRVPMSSVDRVLADEGGQAATEDGA